MAKIRRNARVCQGPLLEDPKALDLVVFGPVIKSSNGRMDCADCLPKADANPADKVRLRLPLYVQKWALERNAENGKLGKLKLQLGREQDAGLIAAVKRLEERAAQHFLKSGVCGRMSLEDIQHKCFSAISDKDPERYEPLLSVGVPEGAWIYTPFDDPILNERKWDLQEKPPETLLLQDSELKCVVSFRYLWRTGSGWGVKCVLEKACRVGAGSSAEVSMDCF